MEFPDTVQYKEVSNNVYKLKIYSKEDVEEFMLNLEKFTRVTWTIHKTFKTSEKTRNLFKRIYFCHFNTRCRKNTKQIRNKRSRNINCPAKLFITIRRFYENSKSKEKVDKQYPCIVELRNIHNHRVDVADALRERPVGPNAKQEILHLFEKGHSAASAYHTFYTTKMELYGNEYNNKILDRFYFPTKTDVTNLWQKTFKQKYGERIGSNMVEKLEEILTSQNGTLFKIVQVEEHYGAAISTPLMQRAQKLPQASEILFVDATGNCDLQNHKVYFFLTQSEIGGVPIACVLSSSQKSEVFDAVVKALLDIIPDQLQPKVIMTDDDLNERKVLQKHFPTSKLLLCVFHVLKACWRWLNMSKNDVPKSDKQHFYQMFRKLVYARSESDLEEAKEYFYSQCKHTKFRSYVEKMFIYIDDWSICYRKNLPLRGSDTNNYAEVMFRLLKDIPLERTKAFNLPQLADFICTSFESYYTQRILDIVLGRVCKVVQERYMRKEPKVIANIKELGDQQYSVQSFSNPEIFYTVDMIFCKCTCVIGHNGRHCKHQAAVILKYNILFTINTVSHQNKLSLFELATGTRANEEMFLPLLHDEQGLNLKSNKSNRAETNWVETVETNSDNNVDDFHKAVDQHTSDSTTSEIIEELKARWKQHTDHIFKNLTDDCDDPINFVPAVTAYLDNANKYGKSTPALLSGLHTSFKHKGQLPSSCKRKIITRRGTKISVQPTAISRRKTTITGKRRLLGRPSEGGKVHMKKAPHSLNACVLKGQSIGDTKQKK